MKLEGMAATQSHGLFGKGLGGKERGNRSFQNPP